MGDMLLLSGHFLIMCNRRPNLYNCCLDNFLLCIIDHSNILFILMLTVCTVDVFWFFLSALLLTVRIDDNPILFIQLLTVCNR